MNPASNGEGETNRLSRQRAVTGCLLGAAIGDAYALPYEGLAPSRIRKIFHPGGYHFFFGKGMVSDDTEHAVMTAQALVESGGGVKAFRRSLAWKMRIWILLLPAGVGFATLRSCLKLWFSFLSICEGAYSAGNGPMMRSPIIGVYCGGDIASLKNLVRVSTRLTHTDPRAEHGAVAVALAAWISAQGRLDVTAYLEQLRNALGEEGVEMVEIARKSAELAISGATPEEFAERLQLQKGGSGFVNHTTSTVIYLWLRHGKDLKSALDEAILLGGDTDTVAAIAGGVIGAGMEEIQRELRSGIIEWPMTLRWMESLAEALARSEIGGGYGKAPRISVFGRIARNIFFLLIVLLHGLKKFLSNISLNDLYASYGFHDDILCLCFWSLFSG